MIRGRTSPTSHQRRPVYRPRTRTDRIPATGESSHARGGFGRSGEYASMLLLPVGPAALGRQRGSLRHRRQDPRRTSPFMRLLMRVRRPDGCRHDSRESRSAPPKSAASESAKRALTLTAAGTHNVPTFGPIARERGNSSSNKGVQAMPCKPHRCRATPPLLLTVAQEQPSICCRIRASSCIRLLHPVRLTDSRPLRTGDWHRAFSIKDARHK